jgi:H+/Cl- antiporter ClcA
MVQREIAQLETERNLVIAAVKAKQDQPVEAAHVEAELATLDDITRRQSVLVKEQTELRYSKAIRHRRASVIKSEKVRRSPPAWLACIAIGILVGLADAAMIQSLQELFQLKTRIIAWTADQLSTSVAFFILLAYCLPMTLLATVMVIYVAPKAAGSGLAEVKAMLNGCSQAQQGLLTFTTAFVKIVGVVLAITGGLALGREGPMVHVGAAMANFILHVPYFKKRIINVHSTRRANAIFNVQSYYVNTYVIMGGAAGVAAAFNAPITGVLYMLEEMASHWPMSLTVRVFVSTSFAAFVMQCVANGMTNVGEGTSAFMVNDHNEIARFWVAADIPLFILIGIAGGLLSSCLIICCKQVFLLRRRVTAKLGNMWSIFEVGVLTLIAVLVLVFLPLAFPCASDASLFVDADGNVFGSHAPTDGHRLLEEAGKVTHSVYSDPREDGPRWKDAHPWFARYRCDEHHHNQMASLAQWNPEHTIVMLWGDGLHFDTKTMLVYLLIYMVQFVLLPGSCCMLHAPCGITRTLTPFPRSIHSLHSLAPQDLKFLSVPSPPTC